MSRSTSPVNTSDVRGDREGEGASAGYCEHQDPTIVRHSRSVVDVVFGPRTAPEAPTPQLSHRVWCKGGVPGTWASGRMPSIATTSYEVTREPFEGAHNCNEQIVQRPLADVSNTVGSEPPGKETAANSHQPKAALHRALPLHQRAAKSTAGSILDPSPCSAQTDPSHLNHRRTASTHPEAKSRETSGSNSTSEPQHRSANPTAGSVQDPYPAASSRDTRTDPSHDNHRRTASTLPEAQSRETSGGSSIPALQHRSANPTAGSVVFPRDTRAPVPSHGGGVRPEPARGVQERAAGAKPAYNPDSAAFRPAPCGGDNQPPPRNQASAAPILGGWRHPGHASSPAARGQRLDDTEEAGVDSCGPRRRRLFGEGSPEARGNGAPKSAQSTAGTPRGWLPEGAHTDRRGECHPEGGAERRPGSRAEPLAVPRSESDLPVLAGSRQSASVPRGVANSQGNSQGYHQGSNQRNWQEDSQGHSQCRNQGNWQEDSQGYSQCRNQGNWQEDGQGFSQGSNQRTSQGNRQGYSQGSNQRNRHGGSRGSSQGGPGAEPVAGHRPPHDNLNREAVGALGRALLLLAERPGDPGPGNPPEAAFASPQLSPTGGGRRCPSAPPPPASAADLLPALLQELSLALSQTAPEPDAPAASAPAALSALLQRVSPAWPRPGPPGPQPGTTERATLPVQSPPSPGPGHLRDGGSAGNRTPTTPAGAHSPRPAADFYPAHTAGEDGREGRRSPGEAEARGFRSTDFHPAQTAGEDGRGGRRLPGESEARGLRFRAGGSPPKNPGGGGATPGSESDGSNSADERAAVERELYYWSTRFAGGCARPRSAQRAAARAEGRLQDAQREIEKLCGEVKRLRGEATVQQRGCAGSPGRRCSLDSSTHTEKTAVYARSVVQQPLDTSFDAGLKAEPSSLSSSDSDDHQEKSSPGNRWILEGSASGTYRRFPSTGLTPPRIELDQATSDPAGVSQGTASTRSSIPHTTQGRSSGHAYSKPASNASRSARHLSKPRSAEQSLPSSHLQSDVSLPSQPPPSRGHSKPQSEASRMPQPYSQRDRSSRLQSEASFRSQPPQSLDHSKPHSQASRMPQSPSQTDRSSHLQPEVSFRSQPSHTLYHSKPQSEASRMPQSPSQADRSSHLQPEISFRSQSETSRVPQSTSQWGRSSHLLRSQPPHSLDHSKPQSEASRMPQSPSQADRSRPEVSFRSQSEVSRMPHHSTSQRDQSRYLQPEASHRSQLASQRTPSSLGHSKPPSEASGIPQISIERSPPHHPTAKPPLALLASGTPQDRPSIPQDRRSEPESLLFYSKSSGRFPADDEAFDETRNDAWAGTPSNTLREAGPLGPLVQRTSIASAARSTDTKGTEPVAEGQSRRGLPAAAARGQWAADGLGGGAPSQATRQPTGSTLVWSDRRSAASVVAPDSTATHIRDALSLSRSPSTSVSEAQLGGSKGQSTSETQLLGGSGGSKGQSTSETQLGGSGGSRGQYTSEAQAGGGAKVQSASEEACSPQTTPAGTHLAARPEADALRGLLLGVVRETEQGLGGNWDRRLVYDDGADGGGAGQHPHGAGRQRARGKPSGVGSEHPAWVPDDASSLACVSADTSLFLQSSQTGRERRSSASSSSPGAPHDTSSTTVIRQGATQRERKPSDAFTALSSCEQPTAPTSCSVLSMGDQVVSGDNEAESGVSMPVSTAAVSALSEAEPDMDTLRRKLHELDELKRRIALSAEPSDRRRASPPMGAAGGSPPLADYYSGRARTPPPASPPPRLQPPPGCPVCRAAEGAGRKAPRTLSPVEQQPGPSASSAAGAGGLCVVRAEPGAAAAARFPPAAVRTLSPVGQPLCVRCAASVCSRQNDAAEVLHPAAAWAHALALTAPCPCWFAAPERQPAAWHPARCCGGLPCACGHSGQLFGCAAAAACRCRSAIPPKSPQRRAGCRSAQGQQLCCRHSSTAFQTDVPTLSPDSPLRRVSPWTSASRSRGCGRGSPEAALRDAGLFITPQQQQPPSVSAAQASALDAALQAAWPERGSASHPRELLERAVLLCAESTALRRSLEPTYSVSPSQQARDVSAHGTWRGAGAQPPHPLSLPVGLAAVPAMPRRTLSPVSGCPPSPPPGRLRGSNAPPVGGVSRAPLPFRSPARGPKPPSTDSKRQSPKRGPAMLLQTSPVGPGYAPGSPLMQSFYSWSPTSAGPVDSQKHSPPATAWAP
ncbi:hypothetical protein DIPPA_29147 [Diplonema papillatum]|nr:hypothetical protein DIPPA_29147 [Diplonema papillatum]